MLLYSMNLILFIRGKMKYLGFPVVFKSLMDSPIIW